LALVLKNNHVSYQLASSALFAAKSSELFSPLPTPLTRVSVRQRTHFTQLRTPVQDVGIQSRIPFPRARAGSSRARALLT